MRCRLVVLLLVYLVKEQIVNSSGKVGHCIPNKVFPLIERTEPIAPFPELLLTVIPRPKIVTSRPLPRASTNTLGNTELKDCARQIPQGDDPLTFWLK
jgi:hypothetical protein